MSQALYRKYRSKSLAEVVGQGHVTSILARSLAAGKVAHAYLLTGPRGVGKTSIARILAHEINKLPYADNTTNLDIIEIDAASNNSVEDVRDLREKVQIAPVSASKKIYIIDEVHMLSKAAFNALLKTLEEPPEHAVFILATTDADKLPATIISRTQRFHFRAITPSDAVKHLRYIADAEGIKIDDEALQLIATRGDGSFRDSISLLDQLSNLTDDKTGITRALVEQALGLAPSELVEKLVAAYTAKDLAAIVTLLTDSEQNGVQATVLANQLVQSLRTAIAAKPQLLPLLDGLLDVAKSSQPAIKLLTTLAAQAVPKPKTAALEATMPVISASIDELKKQSASALEVSSHPTATFTKHLQPEHKATSGPEFMPGAKPFRESSGRDGEQEKSQPLTKPENNAKHKTSPEPIEEGTQSQEKAPTTKDTNSAELKQPLGPLDWPKLLAHTQQNHVAFHSVLAKCTPEPQGNILKLYTGGAFYKKKLDDAKYRIVLLESLRETGAGDWEIETIPTPPPPKDSTAAAVAAIMGGGEEVSVAA